MLILASGSPRRKEILTMLGYSFLVDPADVDESYRIAIQCAADGLRRAGNTEGAVGEKDASAWRRK